MVILADAELQHGEEFHRRRYRLDFVPQDGSWRIFASCRRVAEPSRFGFDEDVGEEAGSRSRRRPEGLKRS